MSGYRAQERGFTGGTLLLLILFIGTALGVAWVCTGIVTSERWPIRWLQINGAFQRVSAEQLRASLAPRVGSNFFTVDLEELRTAAGSISWVSVAKIKKQWPDTVVVAVEEYVPVAHWNHGWLISREAEPFAVPEADDIQGLPWLEGPEPRLDEVLQNWLRINELLLPLGLEVGRLKLDRRGAWSMVLDNGTHVQIGRDATGERLQRLLASWTALMRGREVAPVDVDLRYTNGFAVTWPSVGEPEESTRTARTGS